MSITRIAERTILDINNTCSRREFISRLAGGTALLLTSQPLLTAQADQENMQKNKQTGFACDSMCLAHDTGEGHPESPERLMRIMGLRQKQTWQDKLKLLEVKKTDVETVNLVHTAAYIELVKKDITIGKHMLSTGDTVICKNSLDAALTATGCVIAAVDAVMSGKIKNAFCAVRPPGHHASAGTGRGFCIFNNAAIGARYAQKKYGVEQVLIADWDVHHGNGTQDIFYQDNTVYYMSTHQSPWYPGTGHREETGKGKGKGFTMNRPFPANTGNHEIIGAFKDDLLPEMKLFKPDLTIISAGFDSRENDPLGRFRLTDHGFRELTQIMMNIASINGKGRIVSILEGGYNLTGLESAVDAHVMELASST